MKLIKNECKGVIKIQNEFKESEDSLSKSPIEDQDEVINPIYGLRFS
jgi:hypothetical protein